MKYLRIYESTSGGVVDLHPLHGNDELPANTKAATIMADNGHSVELLPGIPSAETELRSEWLWDVFGFKNPDVRIDGYLIGEIKTPMPGRSVKQSTINRCIYACAQQKVAIAIINLQGNQYSMQDIKKGIIGALQPERNKSIEEVRILTDVGNLFKVDRNMFFDETIYETLNKL